MTAIDLGSRRRPSWLRFLLTPLFLALAVACDGEGDVGEECDEPGNSEECVEGAVCTNEGDGDAATCRALCEEHEDCAADEQCNGISKTDLKSCQPQE